MTSRYNDCGGGASWQVIDRGFGELHAITISPVDSQIIYLGGLNGVFKSVDGGASWMQLAAGLDPAAEISDIVIDPLRPNVVYVGTTNLGVFYSSDGGDTFQPLNQGTPEGHLPIVDLDLSADGGVLYAAVGLHGVYRLGAPAHSNP